MVIRGERGCNRKWDEAPNTQIKSGMVMREEPRNRVDGVKSYGSKNLRVSGLSAMAQAHTRRKVEVRILNEKQ